MERLHRMGLLTRLIISFTAIILVACAVLCGGFYLITRLNAIHLIQKDVFHLIQKNNRLIDSGFQEMERNALRLVTDPAVYNAIKGYEEGEGNIIMLDRVLNEALSRHQLDGDYILDAYLLTSYSSFGKDAAFYNLGSTLPREEMLETAQVKKGAVVYFPTMTYADVESGARPERPLIFSSVCLVNSSYVDSGGYYYLPPQMEKPFLVVNYRADLYEMYFEDISYFRHAENYVITEEKDVIYSDQIEELPQALSSPWIDRVLAGSSGCFIMGNWSDEYIICCDRSKTTGWYIVTKIPLTDFVSESLAGLRLSFLITFLGAVFIAVLIAVFLSRSISRPIQNLADAIGKSSVGEFGHVIVPQGTRETRVLASEYNAMNRSLKTLIDENYMIKMREKDARIQSLQNQMNPHFLYNTLNCINWLALEGDCDKVSEMIVNLSEILQYAIDIKSDVTFKDEYQWMCRYIDIMSIRFEGMFTFMQSLSPEVFTAPMPRLILQPIVENIFIHGFRDRKSGGEIHFSAALSKAGALSICIEDNGRGIGPERLEEMGTCSSADGEQHIGIQNTDKRIKLLCGEAYGITIESTENRGTRVTILLKI